MIDESALVDVAKRNRRTDSKLLCQYEHGTSPGLRIYGLASEIMKLSARYVHHAPIAQSHKSTMDEFEMPAVQYPPEGVSCACI